VYVPARLGLTDVSTVPVPSASNAASDWNVPPTASTVAERTTRSPGSQPVIRMPLASSARAPGRAGAIVSSPRVVRDSWAVCGVIGASSLSFQRGGVQCDRIDVQTR
jgi:hypothetical protein